MLAAAAFALLRPPINGARRWIPLGVTMFQPSELLKVALVLLLAYQLSRKTAKTGNPERALLPALVFSMAAAGVVVVKQAAAVAATSFAAGVVTVAAFRGARAVRARRRSRRRANQLAPVLATRSFLIDVHLLGSRD